MSKIIEITEENFEQKIEKGIVLVTFSAKWCGPCRMMSPVYEKIANVITVGKVDCDEQPNLVAKKGIKSVPTLLLFKDGKLEKTTIGATSEVAILKMIDELK